MASWDWEKGRDTERGITGVRTRSRFMGRFRRILGGTRPPGHAGR